MVDGMKPKPTVSMLQTLNILRREYLALLKCKVSVEIATKETDRSNPVDQSKKHLISEEGFTSLSERSMVSAGTPRSLAKSRVVFFPTEMMPTSLAMASAVKGWSPVTMATLIPAERHFPTASFTVERGGSTREILVRRKQFAMLDWKLGISFLKI